MKQLIKRIIELGIFLLFLSFVSFVLMKLAPGDPTRSMLDVIDVQTTEEEINELREELGFNDPIYVQYWNWLKSFVQFDLGNSYMTKKPVLEELWSRFPSTLAITISSLIVMTFIAVPIGTISALYKDKWIDHVCRVLSLFGAAVPSFWLGLLFIQFFSIKLGWLPSMGKGTFLHLLLPAITLGLAMSAVYIRLLRSSLLETLGQDFIRSARARGLSNSRIFIYHAFRYSLIPVITIFGVSLGSLLGGTVVIEVLFAYPGIGQFVVDAIGNRDYPIIQGYILFMGCFVIVINILVDLSYRFLNPEIRLKEANR